MQIALSNNYTYVLRNKNITDAKNVKIHIMNFSDALF